MSDYELINLVSWAVALGMTGQWAVAVGMTMQ